MKRILSYSAVIISLGLTASAALAQTTANGPYYATPSWDQQLPAATRFIVLSNWIDAFHPSGGAAVLDRETGLVWQRSPSTDRAAGWNSAKQICSANRTGGRVGWRLPSFHELASLFDPAVSTAPVLPAGHPFLNVSAGEFWTATAVPSQPGRAWIVDSHLAGAFSSQLFDDPAFFWCVRGGGPLHQY